jgi:phage terminase large subunit-like protein
MSDSAKRLASLPKDTREELLSGLSPEALLYDWTFWSRPEQRRPAGNWRVWLFMAGRGAGKTRSVVEDIRSEVKSGRRRQIGIIGPTAEALRRVQIEGPSGILACSPPDERPVYEMSVGRLTWPNGAVAHLFTGEEPNRLRGYNLDYAWIDELAAMENQQAVWDMLQFATRINGPLGDPAQIVISTTPRPTPTLKAIIASPDTALTRSRTLDNAANLDPATLAHLQRRYANSTLGRQELDGELLDDVEGALWTRAMLDACRVTAGPDRLVRVVVAIDPSGGSGDSNAECGIVVAAKGADNHGYVLQDASGRLSPERWGTRACDLFAQHRADRIIAEQNFGGAMVENTIRMINPRVPVKLVQASRGKQQRAEPVVALYEQARVHHVGLFGALEDQLCQWVPGTSGPSPDRLDALVWAISELCVEGGSLDLGMWTELGRQGGGFDRFMSQILGR